ncbi:MAG: MmgE/PrpD family protein [Achromobacter veterisilvae]
MTLSEALARFIVSTDAGRLDPADASAAKAAIADCIGCMMAGSVTDSARIARQVATSGASAGAATVIGATRRYSPQVAALANGTAAHALDFDDILWTLYGHPSVTILSSALAIAQDRAATGSELVTAYAIGVEVLGKLGRAVNPVHYEHGWHATASIGVIGAAAACARLLRLDEEKTAMALGIAASQACGIRRNFGTMVKPLHAGNAARAGVFAAELAEQGFTSNITALEDEYGWARTLGGRSVPDSDVLTRTLGEPWELREPGIVLKRYPSCGATHCALDALIALRNRHGLHHDEIERIDCDASPFAHKVLLYSRPATGLEGKFSMEFCLAVAAIEGNVDLLHFNEDWIADPRVTALLPRISFNARADLAPDVSADAVPAEVSVRARGQLFTQKTLMPSGDPRNPMDEHARWRKFLSCCKTMLDERQAKALFDVVGALEMVACADLHEALQPAS